MAKERIYPVGVQTFSDIIEEGMIYVDKTALIYNMAKKYKYVFLSRPRRFGKSLLSSTLHSYFEGREEAFQRTRYRNFGERMDRISCTPFRSVNLQELRFISPS